MSTEKPWDDGADYYSTSDEAERLHHETLDECIEADLYYRTGTIEEVVSQDTTVYAWRRDRIDVEGEAKKALDSMVESLSLSILEEYGDPDGNSEDIFGPEAEETFKAEALDLVKALASKATPWRCHVTGEKTFASAELMEWVRKNNPEWLEGKS